MGGNVVGLFILIVLGSCAMALTSRKHKGYWAMVALFAAIVAAALLLAK